MYISSYQLVNYKSFCDPVWLSLMPGFNIIVGQNNAGKTALIEALSLRFLANPHRSERTVPNVGDLPNQESSVDVSFVVEKNELLTVLKPAQQFNLPLPRHGAELANEIGYPPANPDSIQKLWTFLLRHSVFTFRAQYFAKVDTAGQWRSSGGTSVGLYDAHNHDDSYLMCTCRLNLDQTVTVISGPTIRSPNDDFGFTHVIPNLAARVYHFFPERFNVGSSSFGDNPNLAPNAANLPEVLNILQANPKRFDQYNETVKRILPQVHGVSVRPFAGRGSTLEVLVWPHSPAQRVDLAIPLSQCGTGIGQVLAMLYVVLNSDFPRTILVDEPQSFLHPGAIKKLLEVLQEHPQHQYILATHSSTVITGTRKRAITMVKCRDGVSTLETVDAGKVEDVQAYLAEVGVTLSDLFGADNVLWVEGLTEELCFPKLIERVAKRPLNGTVIRGVRNTGDFTGRHAELIIDIYRRLSRAGSLLPPAVGFVFDDEGRGDQEKEELQKRSDGRVTFTTRRMYENYLLSPKAVAAVANTIEGIRETPLTPGEIDEWFERYRECYGTPTRPDQHWKEYVNASEMLQDCFGKLSDQRVTYRKPEHSVKLTEWILENSPEDFAGIAGVLAEAIEGGRRALV